MHEPPLPESLERGIAILEDRQAHHRDHVSESPRRTHRHEVGGDAPFVVCLLADWHLGSLGTDYHAVRQYLAALQRHRMPVILLGDFTQTSIRRRSVMEDSDNGLSPKEQHALLASVLGVIGPQLIAATWDNHGVQREEELIGASPVADLYSRAGYYFSGIGHLDLWVGHHFYPGAVSHRFRTKGVAGMRRYITHDAPERDWAAAGDSHVPEAVTFWHGRHRKLCVNAGTLQTNSAYAARHFTPVSVPSQPVLEFRHDRTMATYYPDLFDYLGTR